MKPNSDLELFMNTPANMFAANRNLIEQVAMAFSPTYAASRKLVQRVAKEEITNVPDLVKHIKSVYQKEKLSPRSHVPLEQKIKSRRPEDFGFVSEPVLEDQVRWQNNYERKQYVLRSGSLTSSCEPYRALGDIKLDPVQLFLGCFQDYVKEIPDFSCNLSGAFIKTATPPRKIDDGLFKANKAKLCDIIEREKLCKGAGFRYLRHAEAETRHQITNVAASQPYVKQMLQSQFDRESVRRQLAQAQEDEVVKGMKPRALSSDLLNISVTSHVAITGRNNETVQTHSNKGTRTGEVTKETLLRYQHEKRLQAITDKLRYIYILLCSLYNMKNRYLRSRSPLTPDIVKALRHDPFQRRAEPPRSRPDRLRSSSVVSISSRIDTGTNGSSAGGPTPGGDYQRPSSLAVPYFRNQQAKSLLTAGLSSDQGRRRLLTVLGSVNDVNTKVETWEDLLNLGAKTKIMKLLRVKSLPPWQQTWSSDEARAPSAAEARDQRHVEEYHPEEAVGRMLAGFLRVKERSQKSIRLDMEKIERERMLKYRYKTDTFSRLDPLLERQKEVIRAVGREAVRDPVLITDDISPWYEELIKECTSLDVRQEPCVIECLSNMEKFLLEDINQVYNVKEKLCLLVLSLPIYEILTPHVQAAVSFVLTEILDGKVSMLREWLNYRKLYVIEGAEPPPDSSTVAAQPC